MEVGLQPFRHPGSRRKSRPSRREPYAPQVQDQPNRCLALDDSPRRRWADGRRAATGPLPTVVRSVLSHELVHTLQIVQIHARLEALQTRFPTLPADINDDLIQRRLGTVPGMDAAVRAEIDLLYQAAAEPDPGRSRVLARRALGLVQARRVYFADSAAAYGSLEDVVLNMEGVACWGALQLALRRAATASPATVLAGFRGNRRRWSQEEGSWRPPSPLSRDNFVSVTRRVVIR
jgi:hypothetical protein